MNTITIGRNPQNTIVVGAEYTTVSGQHATIEQVGNQIYLQDHSTNGTYVNGTHIHNQRIAISPTDRITLSTNYSLNMQQVMQYLSPMGSPSRATARYVPQTPAPAPIQYPVPQPQPIQQPVVQPAPPIQRAEPRNLDSFNFGAFYFNWIWGVANGVYWALWCLIPYVGFIIGIVLGCKANRCAWEKFNGTAEEFEAKQAAWSKWAWILFGVAIVCILITIIASLS